MSVIKIEDFIPKYPNIDNTEYSNLNPYDDEFYNNIFHKKEFYDNRLEREELVSKQAGVLLKHQQTIARFLSSHTPYTGLLLVHEMGTGKTCSAIGAIEQIRNEIDSGKSSMNGAVIICKGDQNIANFKHELLHKCTSSKYIPENFKNLTSGEKAHRIRKMLEDFYQFKTNIVFSRELKNMSDVDIINSFSNKIIVIDEVHNLRIKPTEIKFDMKMYHQFHRLTHLIQNYKLILLSGTPMKDSANEISTIMNLLLPLNKQLPMGKEFASKYMKLYDNIPKIKTEAKDELKKLFKGTVSFLNIMQTSVKRSYLGEKIGKLKYLTVYPIIMNEFQSKYYITAFDKDRNIKMDDDNIIEDETGSIYNNSRESSLFVYPDGSYGSDGFKKYIKEGEKMKKTLSKNIKYSKRYVLSEELVSALKGDSVEETINNISKCSISYATCIRAILNAKNKCCFVYSSIVKGSGCILFSLLLELVGFSKAGGKEDTKELRYALFTGDNLSHKDLQNTMLKFNTRENMHGELIKVIIGSKAVSEGFSFNNIQLEIVLTPHFNYSETSQALARGIRFGSHNMLLEAGETPNVEIIQIVSIPHNKDIDKSVDLFMYELSENKDVSIQSVMRLLMETAFDCPLNYFRNRLDKMYNYSRECNYMKCHYDCQDMDMSLVKNGLAEQDLDRTTYNIYYTNPVFTGIYKRLHDVFKQNANIELEDIFRNLQDEYNETEITNALQNLINYEKTERLTYTNFLNIYGMSNDKRLMREIENIFLTTFKIDYNAIKSRLKTYQDFELLSTLNTIINDNMVLSNKYGFQCYLRENNNYYYLVDNLNVAMNNEFYVQTPFLHIDYDNQKLMDNIENRNIETIIKQLFKLKKKEQLPLVLVLLSNELQNFLIEQVIRSVEKKTNTKHVEFQQMILEHYSSFIKQTDVMYFNSFLKEKNKSSAVRCYTISTDKWQDCKPEQIISKKVDETEVRSRITHGILGKENKSLDAFCIVDLDKEQEAKQKKSNDQRRTYTGKRCGAGWKLSELLVIILKKLKMVGKLDMSVTNIGQLRYTVSKNKKLSSVYTTAEIDALKINDLRNALYWSSFKIKDLCHFIKEYLRSRNELINDPQCGEQSKIKKDVVNTKTHVYRIDKVVFSMANNDIKQMRLISRLMSNCLESTYKVGLSDDIWYLPYFKNMLIGSIKVSANNKYIKNICILEKYAKHTSAVITQLIDSIGIRKLTLNSKDKNISKLINTYESYGFKVKLRNEDETIMEFE